MKPIQIPFNRCEYSSDVFDNLTSVISSGWLTSGKFMESFETSLKEVVGSKEIISVSSCTEALTISLDILKGTRLSSDMVGDVYTTPFTFVSTINSIEHVGLNPKLVDIRKDTYNIDEILLSDMVNNEGVGVLPVHYGGHPCEMDVILKLATENNMFVVEDAAHSIGASYRGKKVGIIGDATCFSFYATKNISTGEGGAISTNNSNIANIARIMRLHGFSKDAWNRYSGENQWQYDVIHRGYKSNFPDINAAIGVSQVKDFQKNQEKRKELAMSLFQDLEGLDKIILPTVLNNVKHAWHLFPLMIDFSVQGRESKRDRIIKELFDLGISCSVHFIPIYHFTYYRDRYSLSAKNFPNCESVYQGIFSIPFFPSLSEEEYSYLVESIKKVYYKLLG